MTNKEKLNHLKRGVRNLGLTEDDVSEANKLLGVNEIDLNKFQGEKTEIEYPGEMNDIDEIC